MAYIKLNKVEESIGGFDSIIIVKDNGDIPCGVTLDCSALEGETFVKAGYPVVDMGEGAYKATPVSEGAFAVPEGKKCIGVVKHDAFINNGCANVAVLINGVVNAAAAKEHIGTPYTADMKAQMNNINFLYA